MLIDAPIRRVFGSPLFVIYGARYRPGLIIDEYNFQGYVAQLIKWTICSAVDIKLKYLERGGMVYQ